MVEESSPLLPPAEESNQAETDTAHDPEPESGEPTPEPASEPGLVCDWKDGRTRSACKLRSFKEHESRPYCVLHYPGREKSIEFRAALDSKRSNQDFDFRGAWFPDEVDFTGTDFNGTTNFSSATFSADAYFNSATFSAAVNFSSATFTSAAYFTSATFSADAYFAWATFGADTGFQSATFSAYAGFRSATFSAAADFRKATFGPDADFTGAQFGAAANFGSSTFAAAADFSLATFSAAANFRSATFARDANFGEATFSRAANFVSATFGADVDFIGATFSAAADFASVTFSANAGFIKVTFSKDADFRYATFGASVDFSECEFGAAAYFFHVAFRADVNFGKATFSAAAHFGWGTFGATANFSEAAFSGAADFCEVTFNAQALFPSATFSAEADFRSAIFRDQVSFSGNQSFDDKLGACFQFVRIDKPDFVSFHTVTLRPHWFVNVDPRKFAFTDVRWNLKALRIEDETKRLEDKRVSSPSSLLAIACGQLAENAQANNRYGEASGFRYWAMELQRQEMDPIWREEWYEFAFWRLDWWYWATSGYGERIVRAFLMFMGIWLVFALLYTRVGFTRQEVRSEVKLPTTRETVDAQQASEQANSQSKPDEVGEPLPFNRALTYSLGVMSLQRPEPRPLTNWAHTLVTLETIVGPVQAALLALAIRRKFMR